jgi:RHS repeat-associated protein
MRHILSLVLFLFGTLLATAQHQSLNYIRTEHMLDSAGSTSNISVISYDTYGRQEYTIVPNGIGGYSASLKMYCDNGLEFGEWLPVPIGGIGSVTSDYDIEDPGRSFYKDDDPYTWINYDHLDRVTGNYSPGEFLRSNQIRVRHDYRTNTAGSVRRYILNGSRLATSGYYAKESLASKLTTDEDGKSIETFRDQLGRIVLERRGGIADTYYIYNSLGLLSQVLSPQYETDNDFTLYGYEYKYDSRRRMVSKRLPGCDEIKYWYDDGDRMLYMQDGRLRERGLYRFFFYDRLGRLVVQGTCRGFTNGGEYGFVNYDETDASGSLCGSGYILPPSQSVSDAVIETCTYYDDYSFLSLSSIPNSALTAFDGLSGACARGLVTGKVTLSSDGKYSYGITCYDERARPVISRELRSTGTILTERTKYTFDGNPKSVWSEAKTSTGQCCTSLLEYVYSSHTGLLTDTYLTLDSGEPHRISHLSYDAVGRLSSNTRGGNAGRLSYDYNNLRGWPVKISSPQFTEWLSYDDGPGTPMFSGNISSIRWKCGNEELCRGYKFGYDELGRMTSGVYGEGDDISENSDRYTEQITEYTLNSSISGLKRYGKRNDGSFGLIDDLDIEFDGNRVTAVTDHSGNLLYNNSFDFHDETNDSPEYTYDECGSLTSDLNRGISSVEYDNVGMPRRVKFNTGSSTEYVYSSTGEKLCVNHTTAVRDIPLQRDTTILKPINPGVVPLSLTDRTTFPSFKDSLRVSIDRLHLTEKLEYAGPFILRNDKPYTYLFEGGYCSYPVSTTISSASTTVPEFFYYTKDHLGNNRTVVSESGELRQVIHYYPFGGTYGDTGLNSALQPYKYNGKEFDHTHGLNWYDYGARMYSPALPMWTAMDQKCEEYYHLSPYVYCAGNPVINIDPDGRSIWTKIGKATIKIGRVVARNGLSSLNKAETYYSAFEDITSNVSTLTDSNASGWDKVGAAVSLISEISPISIGDIKDAGKVLGKVQNAVHGNSKLSSKAQHAYLIYDRSTNKVAKIGVSGGKIRKRDNKSYRAESQVRKWNREAGWERYESEIIHIEPAGPMARDKILKIEEVLSQVFRDMKELDINRHKKP